MSVLADQFCGNVDMQVFLWSSAVCGCDSYYRPPTALGVCYFPAEREYYWWQIPTCCIPGFLIRGLGRIDRTWDAYSARISFMFFPSWLLRSPCEITREPTKPRAQQPATPSIRSKSSRKYSILYKFIKISKKIRRYYLFRYKYVLVVTSLTMVPL